MCVYITVYIHTWCSIWIGDILLSIWCYDFRNKNFTKNDTFESTNLLKLNVPSIVVVASFNNYHG